MRLNLHRHRPRLFRYGEKKKSTIGSRHGCKLEGGFSAAEELELDTSSSSVMSTNNTATKDGTHRRRCAVPPEETPEEESEFMDNSDRSDMLKPAVMKPMMARLDALQMQQKIQGMNHPDVLFALKHLARAHRRRGETEQAELVEGMLHAGQST